MFRKILLSIIAVCFIFSLCQAEARTTVNRIVAHVNGDSITLLELQNRVEIFLGLFDNIDLDDLPPDQQRETKKHVLEQMINDILMRQEAERYRIEVSSREINDHIQQVREGNNMNEQQFEDHLRRQGMDMQDFRQQVRDSMLRQRVLGLMVRRKTVVTQDEIKAFYEKNQGQYQREKKVRLQAIVLSEYEEAVRLLDRIINDEYTFEEAARNYSQGPAAQDGGDMGLVRWNRLAPEWQEALKNLEAGEISEPFAMRGGGVLLQVGEIQSSGMIPLEEVQEDIRNKLFEDKLDQRYEEYIQGLRDRAVISIRY